MGRDTIANRLDIILWLNNSIELRGDIYIFTFMTDIEHIYISAVRYALGRTTYIVEDTVDFMMNQELSEECRFIMIRDIERQQKGFGLGHKCDEANWIQLLNYLKNYDPTKKQLL